MKNTTKASITKVFAWICAVGAPITATMCQFPIWITEGARQTVSGLFVLCTFISIIPFIKQVKAYFKGGVSAYMIWTILLIMFFAINCIIEELLVVCLVGCVSNWISAGLFKLGDYLKNKPDKYIESDEGEEDNDGANS